MNKIYTTLILVLTVTLGIKAQTFPTTLWENHTDISWYDVGQNEYTITTAEALAGVSQLVAQGNSLAGKTITIAADIDLDAHLWTPIGVGSNFPFSGSVDGGSYTISNLWINAPSGDFKGLFGQTTGASVSNIKINNATVIAEDTSGVLVGNLSINSTMENCHVTNASITATSYNIGGLVGGVVSNSTISKSSFDGDVIGLNQVGGVAGTAWSDTLISECFSKGTVSGGHLIGGLVGYCTFAFTPNTQNIVNNCYSRSTVVATSGRAGGLYGGSDDTLILKNSYTTGTVSAPEFAGAVIGAWGGGAIIVDNTYFDMDTSEMTDGVGGFLGAPATFDIEGKSTVDMKTTAFLNLLNEDSTDDLWTMDIAQNDGYPMFNSLLSIQQNTLETTLVYPTIFTNLIHVDVPSTVQLKSFNMYNVSGALVYEGDLSQTHSIYTENLSAGIYILNIRTESGQITKKVIKK